MQSSKRIPPPPKETLIALYIDQHLSLSEVGEKIGVSQATISRWMQRYGIPCRPHTEIHKAPSKEALISLYIDQRLAAIDVARRLGVVEASVLRWLHRYDIPRHTSHSLKDYPGPPPNSTCERCGQPMYIAANKIKDGKGRYCSKICAYPEHIRTCAQCGKDYRTKPKDIKRAKFGYCSLACRKASRAAHSMLLCQFCGAAFIVSPSGARIRKYCTSRCAGLAKVEGSKTIGHMRRKLASGYRTDIERLVEQALQTLDIPYLFEHRVGTRFIDFALLSLGIALEADGWMHYTDYGKQRDAKRDAELQAQGWQVIHLHWKDINRDALTLVAHAIGVDVHRQPPNNLSIPSPST